MYDRIVIPIDGSDEARHAAKRGLDLARTFDSTVSVVYVVEQRALRLRRTAEEVAQLRESGETALSEIEELASERGQSVTTALLEGKPVRQICEYVEQEGADLIVLGRQGRTGLGKRLLGGVTEQTLYRSDVPVVVVPGGDHAAEHDAGYSRLLVPTDGSENAAVAVPHGVAFGRSYDADVHVLNVVDLQAAGGMFDAGGLDKVFVERLETRGREAVDEVATEIEGTASDLTVETAVERTKSHAGVAAAICEYVESNGIDLVVMSSHGRSNLQRQLLGGVASTVLRTVDVPVLVVKRTT
ncbi:Nucleotide-binding universal stress protein, UspA family [Halogranum amylolyticum]|uniref:Nucleotide-binding universal stress protein, UspA family n=1 Tax=Halogranum amylolyticum TaxID=660520 RepID=A0A1H8WJC2_9EURY|nr:universal stress protein [Halogranum amylolyticum]SEP27736.1 Nucleotide-binding universal stress protein, UspA family [Halogranum amylolyticum]